MHYGVCMGPCRYVSVDHGREFYLTLYVYCGMAVAIECAVEWRLNGCRMAVEHAVECQ